MNLLTKYWITLRVELLADINNKGSNRIYPVVYPVTTCLNIFYVISQKIINLRKVFSFRIIITSIASEKCSKFISKSRYLSSVKHVGNDKLLD